MFKGFAIWRIQISHLWCWSLVASPKWAASDWKSLPWSCSRWGKKVQHVTGQMWVLGNMWTSKLIMQGDMTSTVDTQNIHRVFWTNTINIVCLCVPASLMQTHRNTEQVWRKPHAPEKICLYWLTLVPTNKAKDEKNISKHLYKAKHWKADKLAPAFPR